MRIAGGDPVATRVCGLNTEQEVSSTFAIPQRRLAGAPRSMKMGTTRSPWRYDAAIRHALQSANLRRPAILHYASSAAVSPISQGGPVTPR